MREQQESRISIVTEVVQAPSKLLKGYNYEFFKPIKPLSYVPADLDLLVEASQARDAAHEIMRLGYTVAVKDPYCLTLTRGDSIIDLYVAQASAEGKKVLLQLLIALDIREDP